ncbi:MAG TPA: VacB/RNase II family 3'-5' exoribonuclease [Chlamydiales bacterium]|nr:VacB/RNase II family 3'-5' exoribonuclease [Chlamydiales bacterium]
MKAPKKKSPPKKSKDQKLTLNLTQTLLQYIEGKRFVPSSFQDIVQNLSIAEIHHEKFKQLLDGLVKKKKLKFQNQKYMRAKAANLVTGTISVHHKKGFGFVKNPDGADIFIPKHAVLDAVDGDTVEVEVNPIVSAKGPEGAVIAILKRSRTHLAGTVIGKSGEHYIAFSPMLGLDKKIMVRSSVVLQDGDRMICKVLNWNDEHVEAVLDRRLGHITDATIDVQAAIEEFELPDGFSKEAIAEAKSYGKIIKDIGDRRDLTKWETVTIDPDTAKDFDDAISLIKDDQGHYHLGVHIADVAYYVRPGMHLDEEALTRCNSTYFPKVCIPMLPEALSNELCSLKPKVVRFTQTVLAEIDGQGNLIQYEIFRSAIKSAKRFTYKEALAVLEKKKKSAQAPLLKRMVELCHILKRKRFERGSIDFSMTDTVLILDDQGIPERLEKVEYDITHQMIEEFMLKANEIVATHLSRLGKEVIYRVHEAPSEEAFQDFYSLARAFGFKLPSEPTHRDIQKMFLAAKDSPLLPQLSVGFIRSMRLAAYSADNIGHYGLALEHYCHFTSPIRRYTDLIIQRLLFNESPPDIDIKQIASLCSEKERISFKAESSVILLKKLRFANQSFKEDPMRIYPAVITKVKPFALFFEVQEFSLEGTLHVSEIGNDYYEYNSTLMSFKGKRTGKTYTMGQNILVRLDKIDFLTRQATWSLA